MSYITSEAEAREIIGTPRAGLNLKKIDFLETHSKHYLKMSCLLAIASEKIPSRVLLVATQESQLSIESDTKFSLTVADNTLAALSIQNAPCGLYVLISGFEESLRINGKVSVSSLGEGETIIEIEIDEHYFHCAKSIRRSEFWGRVDSTFPATGPLTKATLSEKEVGDFIRQSPFLLLATQNEKGEADLSPRGDPAGFVRVLDNNKVLVPERPGNLIADSIRNIIVNPSVAMILFIPGSELTLTLIGKGKLTSASALLEASEMNKKIPKIGIELTVEDVYFGVNSALSQQDLWSKSGFGDRSAFPSLGMMISEQMQTAGKIPAGNSAKAIGEASEIAIEKDYKENLY